MSGFIEVLILILFALVIILGIVFLGGVIYWIIWTALFVPINKKFKHDDRVLERDREYNKLEVEYANLVKFTEDQQKIYNSYILKKQSVLDEIGDAEKELKRKQAIIKEHQDKFAEMNDWQDSDEYHRYKVRKARELKKS